MGEWKRRVGLGDWLLRGRSLEEARRWHRQHAAAFDAREGAFVRASAKARTGLRVLRWTAAAAALLAVAGAWGWREWQRSDAGQLTWLVENAPLREALNSSRSWDDRHLETLMLFWYAQPRVARASMCCHRLSIRMARCSAPRLPACCSQQRPSSNKWMTQVAEGMLGRRPRPWSN